MGFTPFNYDKLNIVQSQIHPVTVKNFNNITFTFWERALFQRALSVLEIDLPEEWNGSIKDFFNWCLYRIGFVAVFYDKKFGLSFQPCALNGYDFYYRPTKAIVSNPSLMFGSKTYRIGKDCEILKLTPDFMGIWDIIDYYAEKLSLLDNAINLSLVNSKFSFILGAKNKSAGQAIKKIFDRINRGEAAVVYDKSIFNEGDEDPWQFLDLNVTKEKYLTPLQLADMRTLLHNFDTEVGIPTLPIEKKERMIADEATSMQVDAESRSEVWLNTFNESAIAVNKMFDAGIIARRSNKIKGGVLNESDVSDNNDNV